MLNEKNINFYTLICMEFGVTGGIDIHEEINTGSIFYHFSHLSYLPCRT